MHELVKSWDDEETGLLAGELDRLFALQDKPLGKDKRAILVQEISRSGIPFKAVCQGIRKLVTEDLHSLKLSVIMEAALEFVFDRGDVVRCTDCNGIGIIVMKDEAKRWFALACQCSNGNAKVASMQLARWKGEEVQRGNSGLLCRA